ASQSVRYFRRRLRAACLRQRRFHRRDERVRVALTQAAAETQTESQSRCAVADAAVDASRRDASRRVASRRKDGLSRAPLALKTEIRGRSVLRPDLRVHARELVCDGLLVDRRGDFLVTCLSNKRGETGLELVERPADGIVDAFVFHLSVSVIAGHADVVVGVFVEAVDADDAFARVRAGGRDVKREPLVVAAETMAVLD